MKKTIIIAFIITVLLIVGTYLLTKKEKPTDTSMQINKALSVDTTEENAPDEDVSKPIITETVFIDDLELSVALANRLRNKLFVHGDYIFDFRENNKYYGFFTSAKPYVDGYMYRVTSDMYIYIIDPEEKKCVKWQYIVDDNNTYLYHEDSGTKIPIEE